MHKRSALYFNELAAYAPHKLAIAGNFYAIGDDEPPLTRVGVCVDGQRWVRLGDIDDVVASIVAFVEDGLPTVLSMGRSGQGLLVQGAKKTPVDVPVDAGYLVQIRRVGSEVFGCGSLRQVWKFDHDLLHWTNIEGAMRAKPTATSRPAFHSVDGASAHALYAGGRGGELFKFDGRTWLRVDSPTNKDITHVLAAAEDEVFVCGKGGVLVRGHDDLWAPVKFDDTVTEDFWCLTSGDGAVFASTLHDVYAIERGRGVALPRPDETFSFHKISACDGDLWATGGEGTIARWNGVEWAKYLWPDN